MPNQVQFSHLLTDNRGEPVKIADESWTLARACETALDTGLPTDQNEGLKPKLRRGRLIEQICAAAKDIKPLELAVEDIALIKERVAAVFASASAVRQICLLLDPASEE